MYINNVNYRTRLDVLQNARAVMITIMSNPINSQAILDLISSKLDCLGIYYDNDRHEINITVKKTNMKKIKDYKPNTIYYYGIMGTVFSEFFASNPNLIRQICMETGLNLIGIDDVQSFTGLSLCEIYCIGDKSVNIRF